MSQKQALLNKIVDRSARIGVVGMGYVGLPLAVEFAHSNFRATGFEIDEKKAASINSGISHIIDVPSEEVAKLVNAEKLSATTNFGQLALMDIIIICVPTPLRKTKEPDVSFILAAAEKIQATLRPGQLIILESTTYPGTTDEVCVRCSMKKDLSLIKITSSLFRRNVLTPAIRNFKPKTSRKSSAASPLTALKLPLPLMNAS